MGEPHISRRALRTRVRTALLLVGVFVAMTFVGVAAADSVTTYANNLTLNPGGWAQTSGWNNRDWNRACRMNNSGQMSASYYDTGMNEVAWSGVAWTNCPEAVVSNEGNGYYRARCWHEGSVSFAVTCQAYNIG